MHLTACLCDLLPFVCSVSSVPPTVALIRLEETSYIVGQGEEEVGVCVVTSSILGSNITLYLNITAAAEPDKEGICSSYIHLDIT